MPTGVSTPGVTAVPSTVAMTLACVPTLVMVLPEVMVTVKVCVSPVSRAEAVKPDSVRGVLSYTLLASCAVMVTFLQVTSSSPLAVVTQ